jgi:arylsulfatase A-like enzyme
MFRWYRFSIALVAACLAGPVPLAGGPPRPNILFIFADDHSPKTLSCSERAYGLASTPHIDRLAAGGIRFQAAYLGSWCMPSRASLLTGLHPHAIESMRMEGPYPASTYDPELCPFWPAAFRRAGYQTAQIGKWHTGTDAGYGRDWDHQLVWNRPANPANAGNYYKTQEIDANGERRTVEGYSTDLYSEWACDYIRGQDAGGTRLRDPDRPWYLWLCYGAIHGPTTPAPRHRGRLAGSNAVPPPDILGPRPGKPSYLAKTQAWKRAPSGEIISNGGQPYAAWIEQVQECMLAVDEGVGKVLEALAESGQLEHTLVIYSSDQGFANGEHGMRMKLAPYEATYASPLIISRPGTIPAGRFCDRAVNAADLVVTFFAQAGIDLPWKMHGRDLSPLLQDPDTDWPWPTLYEHTGTDYGSAVARRLAADGGAVTVDGDVPYYAAVRRKNLKYVRYLSGAEPDELYDLAIDPDELTNLAADPAWAESLSAMRKALAGELAASDGEFLLERPPGARRR